MSNDTIIEFKNAALSQRDGLVLRDINLNIKNGEFVYIIGRVGSGKTTLIKTINGELPLKSGTAKVTDFQLESIKPKQTPLLRRRLGVIFQDFQLLTDRTVWQNLEFVLRATGWKDRNAIEKRIQEALEKVDMGLKGFKMPKQLSGGEQQRVVIARSILNDPDIILADEPTGNLDPETSHSIMEILFEICASGRAVIMATHNYSLLKNFPARTLKCEQGKLTEVDKSEEVDFEELK